ncbi:ABC transporter permease [Roseburia sp. OM04-10BH]|jgi:putative ABC transport system permease protein|uniref:ABC transporter permease n=1 Tax=unclassified Roseburia TaxID=2637578 RepID=UPI000E54603D|nr:MULTISPECIES: ABC transporter permease [unclassified Roseburia]RGI46176.1 ABC transporter permease [Roseburia sp. OM04-10BH]RHV43454.1 ABC transporter permease [Roseburia sp. OM04-15AA]RHV58829.1 ABC transporter permease [Roseburia sp. OM04-10AA]
MIDKSIDRDYSAIVDRKSIPGLARLDSELEQHQSFSYLFVIIFVGIAILVIATSMGRMVEQQRTQIGTMNALGLKRHKIMLHYISFSLVVSVVGVILGLLAGTLWGSPAVIDMFANWYIVPGLHSVFHPMYLIIAAGIVAVCVLASYISCRKLLHIKPAEALRPTAPKKGKKCIFERLPFWKKLSFTSQYNLRDISRAKLRSFMCVIGTAVGMLLMIYAVGCNELLGSMIEINFNRVTVGEYQIKFSEDAKTEDVDDMAEELDGEVVMVNQVEVAKKKNAPADEKKKETITVLEGKNLYNILDLNNQIKELTPGTIGISRKLAADLDVKVGDTVYWHLYTKNTWYEAKVGTIYRSLESQGIAYLREDYEKTGAEYIPSFLMTDDKAAKDKTDLDYVTGVNSKSEMQAAYESSMEIMNMMVGMMAVFSILMIVVVLYNSGVLSFRERVKEFATLKVLGLRSSKIRRILSMQNLWLSIIGILIGAPLGNVSLNAMINTNGENFDYNLSLAPVDYIIAGILVMTISMLVSFMFSKRIRKLDMVEILKGVE